MPTGQDLRYLSWVCHICTHGNEAYYGRLAGRFASASNADDDAISDGSPIWQVDLVCTTCQHARCEQCAQGDEEHLISCNPTLSRLRRLQREAPYGRMHMGFGREAVPYGDTSPSRPTSSSRPSRRPHIRMGRGRGPLVLPYVGDRQSNATSSYRTPYPEVARPSQNSLYRDPYSEVTRPRTEYRHSEPLSTNRRRPFVMRSSSRDRPLELQREGTPVLEVRDRSGTRQRVAERSLRGSRGWESETSGGLGDASASRTPGPHSAADLRRGSAGGRSIQRGSSGRLQEDERPWMPEDFYLA